MLIHAKFEVNSTINNRVIRVYSVKIIAIHLLAPSVAFTVWPSVINLMTDLMILPELRICVSKLRGTDFGITDLIID